MKYKGKKKCKVLHYRKNIHLYGRRKAFFHHFLKNGNRYVAVRISRKIWASIFCCYNKGKDVLSPRSFPLIYFFLILQDSI